MKWFNTHYRLTWTYQLHQIYKSNHLHKLVHFTWLNIAFFLCYFGQTVSNQYDLTDSIYIISFYECPLELQNAFKFMIMIAQKPVYFEGF